MRILVHNLYGQQTIPLEARDPHTLEGYLVHMFPEHALHVDPDDGIEALVEHLNETLQGYSIEIAGFESMAKAQEPPTFPKLGAESRGQDVDRVSTGRNLEMKSRLMSYARLNHAPWMRNDPVGRKRADHESMTVKHPGHRGALFQAAGYMGDPQGRAVQDPATRVKIGYVKEDALGAHPRQVEGTFQHERFHGVLAQVEAKHGPQSRVNLTRHLYAAIPNQYKFHLDHFFNVSTGDIYRGKPSEHEERLARLFNYTNSSGDRDLFHDYLSHDTEKRRPYDIAHKRALQALRAIAEIADEDWTHVDPPWDREVQKSEQDLAKHKTGPKFPKLGVPDDRRETRLITRGRELDVAARSASNYGFREGHDPGVWPTPGHSKEDALEDYREHYKKSPWVRTKFASVNRQAMGSILGGSDIVGPGTRSFALGMEMRRNSMFRSPHALTDNADIGTMLHEGLHDMFKRVQNQFGMQGRKNLGRNIYRRLELAHPKEMKTLREFMAVRYPSAWMTAVPEEEHFSTLLNYLNTPGERNTYHDGKGHPEEIRREHHQHLKTLHRGLLQLGHEVDKKWLLEPKHKSDLDWKEIEDQEQAEKRRPLTRIDFLDHLGMKDKPPKKGMKKSEALEKVTLTPDSTADRMRPHEPRGYEAYERVETYPVEHDLKYSDGTSRGSIYHHVFYGQPIGDRGYRPVMHTLTDNQHPLNGTVYVSSASGLNDVKLRDEFASNRTKNIPWTDGEFVQHGETAGNGRGYGFGTLLYKQMLKVHGRMTSDSSTSKGANGVWEKIVKHPDFKGALSYEPGDVHWAEYAGPKPEPISVIHGDGRSLDSILANPTHPYEFEMKSFGHRGKYEYVEVHGRHKGTGEKVGVRGLHIDHEAKRIYQKPSFKGGINHFDYSHKDAGSLALHHAQKKLGYTHAGDLPWEDMDKSERLDKMAKNEVIASGPHSVHYTRRVSSIPTPNYGDRFGQTWEPAGEYMTDVGGPYPHEHLAPRGEPGGGRTWFEHGVVHFENPLVVRASEGDHIGWKQVLAQKYGKTGKALTQHLQGLGHDGVIVKHHTMGHNQEVVNFSARKDVLKPFEPEAEKYTKRHVMKKSERNLLDGSSREAIEDMHGFRPHLHSAFAAARYLTGGKTIPTGDMMRRALWRHSDDMEAAALHAHNVAVNDTNRKALRVVQHYQTLGKAESPHLGQVTAGDAESEETAKQVNAAISDGQVEYIKLGGRHSNGSLLAHKDKLVFLLKPGSGGQSPASGAQEDSASQSRREAAFWRIASAWGLEDSIPRADLLVIDGQEYAAIHMLPFDWKNLAKTQLNDQPRVFQALDRYRDAGLLHRWAILDFVLGNPDRHGQNMMISPDGEIRLIDHGSAFAGENFDPANDQSSFVPYYLRARVAQDNFNHMSVEQKVKHMPTLHPNVERETRDWLMALDAQMTADLCQQFGIDPTHVARRLDQVKALPGPVDKAINRLWVTV